MKKATWETIASMYNIVKEGISKRADNELDGYKISVYSMGKNNPVIRIDIKEVKK